MAKTVGIWDVLANTVALNELVYIRGVLSF